MNTLLLLLVLAAAQPVAGWYIPIIPPFGGTTFNIGPWPNEHDCKDMAGSFMYAHGPDCHLTGSPADCNIRGNGFAYPDGTPYPPPAEDAAATRIVGGCFFSHTIVPQPNGNYFLEYHALPTPGGSAQQCGHWKQYKALSKGDPLHYRVARVHDACGGKCWPSRYDNACE